MNKQIQIGSLLKLNYHVHLIAAYMGVISAWDKFWRTIIKQFYAFQLGESNHFILFLQMTICERTYRVYVCGRFNKEDEKLIFDLIIKFKMNCKAIKIKTVTK